jgi:HK97 family phage prohead protease
MDIETKQFNGKVIEVKEESRNGVKVGLISGYIATWDLDRWDDQFVKGAFLESIAEHKGKKRQIRFKDHHRRTVGGYPIEGVKEDERGLFGTAEVNLEVQQGFEAFSLAKQGVLVDKSIGFSAIDWEIKDDIRIIHKAIVWEGSIVDEPMNEKANIVEVKSAIEKAASPEELKKALMQDRYIPRELVESIVKCFHLKDFCNYEDLKDFSDRELEEKLKDGIKFSDKNAKVIIATLKAAGLRDADKGNHRDDEQKDWEKIVTDLKTINQLIKENTNA